MDLLKEKGNLKAVLGTLQRGTSLADGCKREKWTLGGHLRGTGSIERCFSA